MKNAARGRRFALQKSARSDADPELTRLPAAGVRVEIVWGAPFEFIALAKFAAQVKADGGNGHSDGEPSDDPEGFALVLLVEKRQSCGICGHGWIALLGR